MIKLTPKEEKFAKLYLQLGSASEAYRQSFDVPSDKKDQTIWSNAHKVLNKENVSLRIAELEEQAMVVHNITVENLVAELDEIRELAIVTTKGGKPQLSAAVSAINTKMKLAGLDKTTIDHTSSDGTMSPVVDYDFSKLEDDELVELKRLLQKATP